MTRAPSTEKAAASLAKDTATAVDQTTTKEFDMTQCNQNRPVKAPEAQAVALMASDGIRTIEDLGNFADACGRTPSEVLATYYGRAAVAGGIGGAI